MKLVLKDFQNDAVDQFVQRLRRAAREAVDEPQAISLASPTGSGKTVMATAAIERLLKGDENAGPMDQAVFLWITDQPELNEQTRQKMLDASDVLTSTEFVVIDTTFDQETFTPGHVTFLNIQKLGKEKTLVTPGDQRTFTIWETIRNTIEQYPSSFFVFIDEAHRGMTEQPKARQEAVTIVQKFIKGSAGEIPPVPLIVGISATPERFNQLVSGTNRTARPVVIDPQEVRSSGLLKETITFYHPSAQQPSDMTMLREATRSWKRFKTTWNTYCEEQEESKTIAPLLLVQVQDGTARQLSKTNLGEAIEIITEEVGQMPSNAFAHAFQEGHTVQIDERELRYLAPSAIQNDTDVQVVFFKTSLNTGWDCPRAEVMMSFRTAKDATLIAQLVGRMVRTPLARRIDTNEYLNTVALYLPHYDEQGLDRVIQRLHQPDHEILPPVDVERGSDTVTLTRAARSDAAFDALSNIPSYVIPKAHRSSEVQRLMKLARLLANDAIDAESVKTATRILLATLTAQHTALVGTEPFTTIVMKQGKLDIRAVEWELSGTQDDQGRTVVDVATANIDDLFDAAGRKLGEGLHKIWWRERVAALETERQAHPTLEPQEPEQPQEDTEIASSDDADSGQEAGTSDQTDQGASPTLTTMEDGTPIRRRVKLEVIALAGDPSVARALEREAQKTTQEWLQTHKGAIQKLPEGNRQAYDELRKLAKEPEQTVLTYPDSIQAKVRDAFWHKHLYVDTNGTFPEKLNGWETSVITEEIARDDVQFWLRNTDRKQWALCIPYENAGTTTALYPDFLVIRSTGNGDELVVDILDPHLIDLADAPAKAAGMAKYAAKHAHEFGRIELIILRDDAIKRLDLTDEPTREQVKGVQTNEHLRQLFDT